MEFVESINDQSLSPSYRLAHGISVRGEKFGLLFYNSKGPKLIFVRSGPWIDPIFFSGQLDLKHWIQTRFSNFPKKEMRRIEAKLLQVLLRLVEKGLIVETAMDS
jgi:hypothetical protein